MKKRKEDIEHACIKWGDVHVSCMQGKTHILARLFSFHLGQRLGVARVSMSRGGARI